MGEMIKLLLVGVCVVGGSAKGADLRIERPRCEGMAEAVGYEGSLKFTFLASQGRSYTVDTTVELKDADWRQAVFVDAEDGAEKSRLNTSSTKAAAYRTIYVLKENLKQQFWKLKVE